MPVSHNMALFGADTAAVAVDSGAAGDTTGDVSASSSLSPSTVAMRVSQTRRPASMMRLVLTGAGIVIFATLSYSMIKYLRERRNPDDEDEDDDDASATPSAPGTLPSTPATTPTGTQGSDPAVTGSDAPTLTQDQKLEMLLHAFGSLQQQVIALGQFVGQHVSATAKTAAVDPEPSNSTAALSPSTSEANAAASATPEARATTATSAAPFDLQTLVVPQPKVVVTAYLSPRCQYTKPFKTTGVWDQVVAHFGQQGDSAGVYMRVVDMDSPEGQQETEAMKIFMSPTIVVTRVDEETTAPTAPTLASVITILAGLPNSAEMLREAIETGLRAVGLF